MPPAKKSGWVRATESGGSIETNRARFRGLLRKVRYVERFLLGVSMALLTRYRRSGGFRQLILLIETSPQERKDKLLKAIEGEDEHWAHLIKEKMITSDMVFGWKDDVLAKIFAHLQPHHCAVLMSQFDSDKQKRLFHYFHPTLYSQVKSEIESESEHDEAHLRVARNHLIEVVRYLDEEKKIDLREVDPDLDLSEVEAS